MAKAMLTRNTALSGRVPARLALSFGALAAIVVLAPPAAAQSAARAAQSRTPEAQARPEVRRVDAPGGWSASLPSALPQSLDVSRFSFTAPGRVTSARPQAVERSFRFTPSGQPADRRAVSVGVTARALAPTVTRAQPVAAPVETSMLPSGYGLDVAVGWRGFALSTGMSRVDQGVVMGERQGVDLGLSYGRRDWRTSILAGAEREEATTFRPSAEVERYNLGAEGMVRLSEALSITGGVRYRTAPLTPAGLEPDREDRSVFLGGAVRF